MCNGHEKRWFFPVSWEFIEFFFRALIAVSSHHAHKPLHGSGVMEGAMKHTRQTTKRTRTMLFGLIVLVFAGQTFSQAGTWSAKASMPKIRSAPMAALIGGIVDVSGNNVRGDIVGLGADAMAGNTRTTLARLPKLDSGKVRRYGAAVGAIDGSPDNWTTNDPLPTTRAGFAANVIGEGFSAIGAASSTNLEAFGLAPLQCTYSLFPTSQSFGPSGGSDSVSVLASAGCNWTAASNVSWIVISSGSSGSGNGTVEYSVACTALLGGSRMGTLTIAGQTFTVDQALQLLGPPCPVTFTPSGQSFSAGAGTSSFSVSADCTCLWSATSNANWITISSGKSGSGNGTVTYSIASNATGSARSGAITVNDQTFTVTQEAAVTCTYSISSTSQSFPSTGGSGNVSVTAPAGCAWTATSNATWITVSSGSSGNGSVSYLVLQNPSTMPRTGTLIIAGQTLTVSQAGAEVPGPEIIGASISGKHLIVTGRNFDSGAVILMNGAQQNTKHDSPDPNVLKGKKVGKKIADGQTVILQVRNSDGRVSPEFRFTRGGPPVPTFTLTIFKTGNGSGRVTSSPPGIDCGTDCAGTYAKGEVVTLTAIPDPGCLFTGWEGACAGTDSCSPTIDASKSVTAKFSTLPSLAPVTYMTKDHDSLTVTFAYPGYAALITDPNVAATTVREVTQGNGGMIVDASPRSGLFVAQVAPGQEARFLSALYSNPWVRDGAPLSPIADATRLIQIENLGERTNETDVCRKNHAAYVEDVLRRSGNAVEQKELGPLIQLDIPYYGTWVGHLASLVEDEMNSAAQSGQQAVINLSLQSLESAAQPSTDNRGCATGLCREVRREQLLFLTTLLQKLEFLDANVANNAVLVVSAGNAGVDLDVQLQALKAQFPNAWQRMRIVGATDSSGTVVTAFNSSRSNMVFARGVGVSALGNSCSGTSFAAPEVARIIDFIWRLVPGLRSDQVIQAFDQALAEEPTPAIPQDPTTGRATQSFIDKVVTKARAIITPPPSGTLTWQVTGTVTINGVSSGFSGSVVLPRSGGSGSFNAGAAVITVSVSGSVFAVGGSGLGVGDCLCGLTPGTYSCQGGGAGQGPITESATAFSAAGAIGGTLNCTCSCNGSLDTFPITGSFAASAAK